MSRLSADARLRKKGWTGGSAGSSTMILVCFFVIGIFAVSYVVKFLVEINSDDIIVVVP